MASPPPLPPTLAPTTAGHASIQTTTSILEPAPELLLTRGCEKRSLAALEPEFVDSNDINGMAPSSAVLQSDFLIMDDANNLEDKVGMAGRGLRTTSIPIPPAQKRVRYSRENEPTASDFAQLEPVIQPYNRTEGRSPSTIRSGSRSLSLSKSTTGPDPLSSHIASVYTDQPERAVIYSEPVDCSTDLEEKHSSPQDRTPKDLRSSSHSPSNSPNSEPSSVKSMEVDSHYGGGDGKTSHPRPTVSRSSSLFMPTPPAGGQRRNSTVLKKGVQRPVRIQLIDGAESEALREQVRRASISEHSSLWNRDLGQTKGGVDDTDSILTNDSDSDGDIALPKEDPTIHDWDEEELEDDQSEIASSTRDSSPMPQASGKSGESSRSIMKSIRKEAIASSSDTDFDRRRIPSKSRYNTGAGRDRDGDDWDPLLDPERENPAMSEDQEAELHNVHLRQENRREFQDAAGLDLGENDAQAVNEDGQYGGTIEDDDEGEDYWENR
ncbi:hypothetical protein BGX34_003045 [Mortierella sp. NVP85]|nr:hypothetical protein BGX34_003045 [Mortierella sp. NVP85]